jgi:flagellar assembly protein FliH
MKTESEARAPGGEAGAPSPAGAGRLAYGGPGAVSVPARPEPAELAWRTGERKGERKGAASAEAAAAAGEGERARIAQLEERLRAAEAASAAALESLRREGREAAERARREAEEAGRAALERTARQVASALEGFVREREAYFARVEREVVELALAIAARILHRESLLDPLLLAGAVRVALGQLGETAGARLRCPAEDAGRWRELLSGLAPGLEIAGDASLGAGECRLEAQAGSVDLGVRAQLEEVERGFFDILEQRPGAGPGAGLRGGPG